MHDTMTHASPITELFQVAVGQMGYFTARQAREVGVSNDLVKYHVGTGRFIRAYRGVYRFRDYPPTMREEVMAAWLAVGKEFAVVSHESALDLLGISDIIPNAIEITVPREKRYLQPPLGITLHASSRPLLAHEIDTRYGINVTSPERTIVDVAEASISEEHVERAVADAMQVGLSTVSLLRESAVNRSERVQEAIERAIDLVAA